MAASAPYLTPQGLPATVVARWWFYVAYTAVKWFFTLCCRVTVEGREHLPSQRGVVFVSNHISVFDTILLPQMIMAAQGVATVWAPAKAELFQSRLGRALLTPLGVFPVRRGQHDRQAMRRMIHHMQTGRMMLFPEGTRSPDGRLQEGKRTVGKLLHAAQPVVIPTAILGTDRIVWHLKRLYKGRAPVTIRYGPPVDVQQYYALPDSKDTSIALTKAVMQAIACQLHAAGGAAAPPPAQGPAGTGTGAT